MAAPFILQHKSGFVSASGTISVSFTNPVSKNNMILVCVGTTFTGNATVNTPTMTGETFSNIAGMSNPGSGTTGQIQSFSTNSAAGGQVQVTTTSSSAAFDIHMHIFEIVGQTSNEATGNIISTISSLAVTTSTGISNLNNLNIAFFYDRSGTPSITAGFGYVQVELSNNVANGDVGFSESGVAQITSTQTATATSSNADAFTGVIISILGQGSIYPGDMTPSPDVIPVYS